jgi:hypothetical protein
MTADEPAAYTYVPGPFMAYEGGAVGDGAGVVEVGVDPGATEGLGAGATKVAARVWREAT